MQYIKLNTNESPYPPPPAVISAVNEDELKKLRLYPNPDGSRLMQKLADFYGVGPKNVIIGNGSDELLAFAFLAFCDNCNSSQPASSQPYSSIPTPGCAPANLREQVHAAPEQIPADRELFCGNGRGAAFPDITYGFYPVYAELFGVPFQQIPLKEDFTIDPADYMGIGQNIILANPNAPTGIALPVQDIEAIAKSNPGHVLLVDEAYVDFGAESSIPLTHKYDNLLVIHTYSKSRSMAGARLAFAIGAAPLIEDLNKMKYSFNPYNVNRLSQLMGEAAIGEELYYAEKRREITATREDAAEKLRALGFSATDSKANFIFAKHPLISGNEFYIKLKEKGILVRHWNKPRISDYLRISIGTNEQMTALITAVEEILKQPQA